MFLRIFFLLAFLACEFDADEFSVPQSRHNTNPQNILEVGGIRQTKLNECLIEIHNILDPTNGRFNLDELCLPRSQISWLFPAGAVTKREPADLSIALLIDTSYSLKEQDQEKKRFAAIKTYLMAIFAAHEKGEIGDVSIQLYPFKYCDQQGEHKLEIIAGSKTTKNTFSSEVDRIIGPDPSKGNEGGTKNIGSPQLNLRAYGARGATNYLHSFARAKEFLNNAKSGAEKHLLIFSDGLPLTFNDGRTEVIRDFDVCTIFGSREAQKWNTSNWVEELTSGDTPWHDEDGTKYHILNSDEKGLRECIQYDLFYPQDTCKRPTGSDIGLSGNISAYDDPLNHVLGMIQHKHVIGKNKGDIKIAAVHLNSCLNKKDASQFSQDFLCQQISPLFFRSFSEDGWYFPVAEADDLTKTFAKVAGEQIEMVYDSGKATLGKNLVDDKTIAHTNTITADNTVSPARIKVDGNERGGKGKGSGEIITHNYDPSYNPYTRGGTGSASGGLVVTQRVANWEDDAIFQIDFALTFADQCRAQGVAWHQVDTMTAQRIFGVTTHDDGVEIQRYLGKNKDYTAWCVVPPSVGRVELESGKIANGSNVSQNDTRPIILQKQQPPSTTDDSNQQMIPPGAGTDRNELIVNPPQNNYNHPQPTAPDTSGTVLLEQPDKPGSDKESEIHGEEGPKDQPAPPFIGNEAIVYGDYEEF